MDTRFCSVS
ncbi:hypothetical protein LINPERHAP1_LOCUS13827 [Linum perenne]